LLIPLAVGLFVYFVVDIAIFSANTAVLQIPRGQAFSWRSFYLSWRMAVPGYMRVSVRNHSFMMPFGVLLSFLYVWWGPVSFIAVLVPFYAVRHMLWETMDEWQTYRDTITTLGTLMQHYHPYTRGHLRRVAELSERLAKEVGRPPRNVMLMADAGMLHDVGKVGVSEEILDKVGKLSDEEWEVIRSHPTKGADILSNLPFLDQIVDWVRYHHKWANGDGYPNDEKHNGDIPVEASIIAVADAFDAMTDDREMTLEWRCDSCEYTPPNGERPDECPRCHAPKRRVYRKPLSLDQAVEQLRRGSGSQFRPELVQAFLTMIDRDGVRLNAD
jgi:putative nucleotidyltransferase with HDIG domain